MLGIPESGHIHCRVWNFPMLTPDDIPSAPTRCHLDPDHPHSFLIWFSCNLGGRCCHPLFPEMPMRYPTSCSVLHCRRKGDGSMGAAG